jgi:glyoxylase-like metal-dependent hydrolase (beta-lactamase superfamily II)
MNVLESDEEIVLIDGGYGIYYEDAKAMLRENGLNPRMVRRIYLTHADADHAGMSGYFAEEFGSSVYLHSEAVGILERGNRAWGSKTPLMELNHCFTALVNEFTGFRVPSGWTPYGAKPIEWVSGFPVIDGFELSGQFFKVLGSAGGHIPGQVFFLSSDLGVVFTADYLLHVDTLSQGEKEILNLPKFMMTSTNVDSKLFRQEMNKLTELIIHVGERMHAHNGKAYVVPGHGDYYPYEMLLSD